ncbi:MAG: hypothetical protein ABI537_05195 [Casimicrobiaceae bacterium]
MTTENLVVPHHQQDTDVYCGAACAQMVLASMGAALASQDVLFTDGRNHTSELASWYNPPDGIQWVMNDRRPGGWFALFSLDTEDALSRKLVWTLHHYQVAAIALVFGGDHWVVVRGYDATAAPATSDDVSYTINAFDINNPWPPVPAFFAPPGSAPPPHGGADGCGIGGVRGVANEHIAYATWQSQYMTTNVYGTAWLGKFVAVCDPDPPPTGPGRLRPQIARNGGVGLMAADSVGTLAVDGARMYGLDQRAGWSAALTNTTAGAPQLVQRLDALDSYYYIVPFAAANGDVRAAVSVNARTGDYRQSIMVDAGGPGILTGFDETRIRALTVNKKFDLPNQQGRLFVRPEAFALSPTMVWQPCLESLSPFYPFHLVTVGAYNLYVRVDGQVFTELHTDIPGA